VSATEEKVERTSVKEEKVEWTSAQAMKENGNRPHKCGPLG
jgi:hypothetical protein